MLRTLHGLKLPASGLTYFPHDQPFPTHLPLISLILIKVCGLPKCKLLGYAGSAYGTAVLLAFGYVAEERHVACLGRRDLNGVAVCKETSRGWLVDGFSLPLLCGILMIYLLAFVHI